MNESTIRVSSASNATESKSDTETAADAPGRTICHTIMPIHSPAAAIEMSKRTEYMRVSLRLRTVCIYDAGLLDTDRAILAVIRQTNS